MLLRAQCLDNIKTYLHGLLQGQVQRSLLVPILSIFVEIHPDTVFLFLECGSEFCDVHEGRLLWRQRGPNGCDTGLCRNELMSRTLRKCYRSQLLSAVARPISIGSGRSWYRWKATTRGFSTVPRSSSSDRYLSSYGRKKFTTCENFLRPGH